MPVKQKKLMMLWLINKKNTKEYILVIFVLSVWNCSLLRFSLHLVSSATHQTVDNVHWIVNGTFQHEPDKTKLNFQLEIYSIHFLQTSQQKEKFSLSCVQFSSIKSFYFSFIVEEVVGGRDQYSLILYSILVTT